MNFKSLEYKSGKWEEKGKNSNYETERNKNRKIHRYETIGARRPNDCDGHGKF